MNLPAFSMKNRKTVKNPNRSGTKTLPAGNRIRTVLFFVLFLFVGILLSVTIREAVLRGQQSSTLSGQYAQYQKQLASLSTENKNLKAENEALQEKRDELTDTVLNEQGFSALAVSLNKARALAGLTSLTGNGVTITLNDASVTDDSAGNVSQQGLIHSQDVQYVVDLLKSCGASAIAVNGERVVGTTFMICTGPTIRVNNSRHPVPFVITAICEPDSTYAVLTADAYLTYRASGSVQIRFDRTQELTIPAYSDTAAIDSVCSELGVTS